ncbi:MAG: MlaC/ttg2D family ABC transporter substrate-binding protein [Rhodospirillales bacterium]
MIRRVLIFTVAMVCITVAAPGAPGARAADDAQLEEASLAFVQGIADDAIAMLTNSETPREIRVQRFRELFQGRFAVKVIGRFVLGRHWKTASPGEQAEYLALFEELMVQRYVDRFAAYSGETLELRDVSVEKPTRTRVRSRILRPDASKDPVKVEWVIGVKGSTMKVLDVFIASVSMAQTLRADFGSIARSGGMPALLNALRDKLTDLSKSSG